MKNWQRAPLEEADVINNGRGFRLTHYSQWEYFEKRAQALTHLKGIHFPHWGQTLQRLIAESHQRGDVVPPRFMKKLLQLYPQLAGILIRDGIK